MRAFTKKNDVSRHLVHELEGAAGGAVVGAVVGSMAGPVGVVAGAVFGGVTGAAAEKFLERDMEQLEARNRELDAQIGVIGGDLGAPNLKHPPAIRGTYSSASSGSPAGHHAPAEGPMPSSGEDDD